MISLKVKMMCILCCLLIFSGSVISATYSCSYCTGTSDWGAGEGGTLPDCDVNVSTRTLGACAGPAQPGSSCTESSKPTVVTRTYKAEAPLLCTFACDMIWGLCYTACDKLVPDMPNCKPQCDNNHNSCRDDCIKCVVITTTWSGYEMGC